jgi:uncharacterized protein (DUF58 family)
MSDAAAQVFSWVQRGQATAQTLPPMLVRAEKIAATVVLGVHGRKRAGPGESFWQYRPYSFGDSTQRIDWRRSALSDRVFIRESEWEAANTLWVWSDIGPRMEFKSHLATETKRDRGLLMALALASLAVRAHERIGGLGGDSLPGYGRSALVKVAQHLLQPKTQTLPMMKKTQRHSTAIVVSDFLDEPEMIKKALVPFAQAGIRGHLVQVCDPAEETLPYDGRVEFRGLDTPARYLARKTEALRTAYTDRFREHREQVRNLARSLDWTFTVHRTDQPPMATLLLLYAQIYDAPNFRFVGAAA